MTHDKPATPHIIHPADVIADRFAMMVKAHGDLTAVIDNDTPYSYRRLDKIVGNMLSNAPTILPDDRIGIVMDHGIRMIAAILAVLRRGAAYVPAEPSFPPQRIAYMMREAGVKYIITDPPYVALPGDGFTIYTPGDILDDDLCTRPVVDAHVRPSDPAYILYTSGTTGKPKGVVVTNGNVCHYARAFDNEFHLRPGSDRFLQYSVCSFDIFVEEVFATLLNGATLVIPPAAVRDDMTALMEYVADREVTIISGFPYLLLELNKLPTLPESLRLLISGGDVLRASYVDRIVARGGIDVYNTYGPSETTVCATYCRCNAIEPLDDGTYPIGTPVRDVGVDIAGRDGHPVDDGLPGQIVISGPGVSAGYVTSCPESANFTTGEDGTRHYLSGDLGYRLPDGNIAFIRRIDHQVMILGKRVECAEVENVLCSCPGVECGAVVAHSDPDNLAYLTAYFVAADKTLTLDVIMRYMAQYLAPFMIPEFFVELQSMPLTASGKIDRSALPLVMKHGAVTDKSKRDVS